VLVCGGAALYGGYRLYKWLTDCPDQAPTTTEMARGGKQNKHNEYSDLACRDSPSDPCKYLKDLYDRTTPGIERNKIKEAMKAFGCTWSSAKK
jgi:hypothetical protein